MTGSISLAQAVERVAMDARQQPPARTRPGWPSMRARRTTPSRSSSSSSGSSLTIGPERFEPAAQDLLRLARGLAPRTSARRRARRARRRASASSHVAQGDASSVGRRSPSTAAPRAPPPRSPAAARPLRARARSPSGSSAPSSSARRHVQRAPRRSRPACGAPPAARRRGTCTAARRGCRARTPRLGRVDRDVARCCPSRSPRSTSRNPSTSIASCRQSSIVWRTSGWSIGTSMSPGGQSLRAGQRRGNARRQQIVGAHAQERRRHALAAARCARASASACAFQRQRVSNIGAVEQRLHQHLARGGRVQVVEHLLQREAVLRAEREHDRLFVGRGLQLEAEAAAEPLAQGEAPGAVDARRRTARAGPAACRRSRRRSARARRAAASARRRARARPSAT